MSGIDVVRQLSEKNDDLNVIMCTADFDEVLYKTL